MNPSDIGKPLIILLVEDSPGDVRLTREAFKDGRIPTDLHSVADGVEALTFLRHEGEHAVAPRPDIILLDLNMPRMDGRQLLAEIKVDPNLMSIPVLILTTSDAESDINRCYSLQANCYITKPVSLDRFMKIIRMIGDFWLTVVKLPVRG